MDEIILAARAEEWLEIGLSTKPTDRPCAEDGVRMAYQAAGLAVPQRFLWFGSPRVTAVAVAALHTELGDPSRYPDVTAALAAQDALPGTLNLGRSLRSQVRTAPWARARQALADELGVSGFARHWLAATRRPWQQLIDRIATPLRARLNDQFGADGGPLAKPARHALLDTILGHHDAGWLGAFDDTDTGMAGLMLVARSAGWWWAFENVALLCERPVEIHRDNLGRLHRGEGPALSYPDGFGVHSWRGMPIPAEVAAELASLTVQRIQRETNAEIRRVMLEHFGFERYLRESGAKRQHSDECGTLWRVDIPGDEPLVMVEVVNSTAEPDGSFRTYFLRVPPQTRTARAGVAWTFGLTEEEYSPTQQT